MPIPIAFMLAAQGAGMVIDYLGRQKADKLAQKGLRLQNEQIEKAIHYSQMQVEDESYRAMIDLRKTLGSQAALFAARGIRPGTSTTALFSNESIGNFNTDERIRRMNQKANEARLRAGQDIAKLHEKTFENENWNAFTKNIINKIPTSPQAYEGLAESFGFKKASTPKG